LNYDVQEISDVRGYCAVDMMCDIIICSRKRYILIWIQWMGQWH